jgi:TnpA family transposase
MVRHYTLSSEDRALIIAKRTAATQLGFAMMLLYLRYPGRVLAAGECPPAPTLAFVARQLGVSKGAFTIYGRRDETRRKHLAELMHALGYQAFSQAASRVLIAQLTPAAQVDPRSSRLATMAVDELRRKKILLPSAKVLELLVQQARARGERLSHRAIIGHISDQQQRTLDQLLRRRGTRRSQRWPGCGLHHNPRPPETFSRSSSALSTFAHSAARPLSHHPYLNGWPTKGCA